MNIMVKLFNNNINVIGYVAQCGFLSEKILIERECHQGSNQINKYKE